MVCEGENREGEEEQQLTAIAADVEPGSGKARRRRTGAGDLGFPRYKTTAVTAFEGVWRGVVR